MNLWTSIVMRIGLQLESAKPRDAVSDGGTFYV